MKKHKESFSLADMQTKKMTHNITFKKIFPTDQVIQVVKSKNQELKRLYGQSSNCEVVVEKPNHKSNKQPFQVRVLFVPESQQKNRNTWMGFAESRDLLMTVQRAFEALEQQLSCSVPTRQWIPTIDS